MKNLLLAAMLFCTNIAIAQGTIEDYRRAYSAGEKFSANKVFYSIQSGLVKRIISGMYEILPTDVSMY
mgnify:CR=1 FL=1